MIADPQVFDEDHVPRRLLHREAAVAALSRAFEPALQSDPAEDVLVVGPSGVGKTVTVRHTLDRLQERATVDIAFVRSMGLSTAGILRAVLEDLGGDPSRTTPLEDLALAVDERVTDPTIVVLDEADDLPTTDALARLTDVDGVSVVPICHDGDDFLARVDDRIRSRLSGHELALDRYGVDELADILAERARIGLRSHTWERPALEAIADEAAGVARVGIQTLRATAEIGAEQEVRSLVDVDVEQAHRRALSEIRAANLASLPFDHQLLYELIREAGTVRSEGLHERYDRVAEAVYRGRDQTPVVRRTRRYKLAKLVDYDLVDTEGEGTDRRYSVCDATITSPVVPELHHQER